jgi:hypothetical protein
MENHCSVIVTIVGMQEDLGSILVSKLNTPMAKTSAMSRPTASNPLDVCGEVVATCTGNAPKR